MKNVLRKLFVGLIALSVLLLAGCSDELHYIETTQAEADEGFSVYSVDIPDYEGKPVAVINDNEPFFTDAEIMDEFFMEISELDFLGRAQGNWMCADEAHIQTGERQSLYEIEPSGWHGNGIYQRSHILMWKLGGPDDERNVITGTETFNQEGMLEYEERVTAYLWRNPSNHVMYRVSPYYEGTDLVARGVLMEAYSVEDGGALKFCVFVYNAEPFYTINYSTGLYLPE